MRAPLVIAVISRVVKNPGAPDWEQILSAGAACQNLILAAAALGYGAQWITEWCGYSEGVRRVLKLAANERVAGFVYVGTPTEKPEERERPISPTSFVLGPRRWPSLMGRGTHKTR